jgi:hypothetical protein
VQGCYQRNIGMIEILHQERDVLSQTFSGEGVNLDDRTIGRR